GRQRHIGGLGLFGQRTFDPADLLISLKRQEMPVAPLEELLERELQEGQGSGLSLHFEEQIAYQVALEGQLHIWQSRRVLNDRTQVLYAHWKDQFMMLFDEQSQFGVVSEPVVEVSTQRQDDEHRATR